MLNTIGLTLEIAGHDLSTVDLYSHKGTLLIPAYTLNFEPKLKVIREPVYNDNDEEVYPGEWMETGEYERKEGKFHTFCSGKWKKAVIHRYFVRSATAPITLLFSGSA